jgi:stage V sporulation protein R
MMENRIEDIFQIAEDLGLDFFPVVFETVSKTTMDNICAYGLPTRARHWSYGRAYAQHKLHGEMGFSRVYELIINNNPSYAFMLDTNTEVQNLFIAAHCLGHSSYFKNNYMFQPTDRNMVAHAAEHAGRIEEYIERYGIEEVEHLMDIGFALSSHINWHKGLYRKPYEKEIQKHKKKEIKESEFDDLLKKNEYHPIKKKVPTRARQIPPYPEKDLLWFFINYAPLQDWERDVLDIIREEAFYFYPQRYTKISNEGFAVYWHAEILYNYNKLTPTEYINFLRTHEKVVNPGRNNFSINPYFLGFKILKRIEKKWDQEHGKGAGRDKIFQVVKEENDISLIRNYLDYELVDELKLFTYGYQENYPNDYKSIKYIEIKEKVVDSIADALVKPLYNNGVPQIVITGIGQEGTLRMKHIFDEFGTLERKFAQKTLEYIWDIWTAPIELETTNDEGKEILMCFDELGFHVVNEEEPEEEKTLGRSGGIIVMP